MGILLLPSLEEKRHIEIDNISQSEAEMFIKNLEERTINSRRLNTPDKQISDAYKIYRLIEDLSDYDVIDMCEELCESSVPKHRGIRAVFVDVDSDTIIVGTTIIYSDKWAMIGVNDTEIEEYLLDIADSF